MNRRTRSLVNPPSHQFHKYLKPGVLARIRDSRISARSHRFNSLCHISFHRFSPPSSPRSNGVQPPVAVVGDGIPCFVGRIFGPRFPQRKKLVAAKSVLYITDTPPDLPPDSSDLLVDSFSSDILVAN